MQALWSAKVPAELLGGRQNLCLCLARGQTHGGTQLIRQRYGLFFVPDERPDFNSLEYFVLPCLEAELRQILHPPTLSSNQLGVEEALAISAQVIRGVAFMHEAGWCHRDIKPDNIMVRSGWRVPPASAQDFPHFPSDGVQIIDFGLGKSWRADKRHPGSVTYFRAQEAQHKGEDVQFLYPSIQNTNSPLMLSHSPPEAYFEVAQLCTESFGASASPGTAAFPNGVVRGDAYDAWGVGLAVDKVLRGNYNVGQQLRARAYRYTQAYTQAGNTGDHTLNLAAGRARVAPTAPGLTGDFCAMLELVAAGDIRRWYWAVVGEGVASGAVDAPLASPASVAPMLTVLKPELPSQLWERLASTQVRELAVPGGLSGAMATAARQLSHIVTRMLSVVPQRRLLPAQALQLPLMQRMIAELLPPGQQAKDVLNTLRRNSSVPLQSPPMGATPQPIVTPPTLPSGALGGSTPVNTPQAFPQVPGGAAAGAAHRQSASFSQPRLPSEHPRSGASPGVSQTRGPPGLSLRVMGAASRSTFDGVDDDDDDIVPAATGGVGAAGASSSVSHAAAAAQHMPPLGGRGCSASSHSDISPMPGQGRDTSDGSVGRAPSSASFMGPVLGSGTGTSAGLGAVGGGFASFPYPPSGLSRQRTVDSSRDPGESALRQMMRQHTRLSGRSDDTGGAYGGGDRPPTKRYSAAVQTQSDGTGVFAGAAASTRGSTASTSGSAAAVAGDSDVSSSSTSITAGSNRALSGDEGGGGTTWFLGSSGVGVPVLPSASVDQVIDREIRGIDNLQMLIAQEIQETVGHPQEDMRPQDQEQRLQALLQDLATLEKQCGSLKAQLIAAFDQQRRLADSSGLTHSSGCLHQSAVEQLVFLVGEKRQNLYTQAKSKTLDIKAVLGE